MEPPFPSFTAAWHNESYPAISRYQPNLSAAGKTVIITGAGGGIGHATALAFNRARASKIVLIGRDESSLKETQKDLSCESSIHGVNVVDENDMVRVASEVGAWDVLILGAGYLSKPAPIKDSSIDEWWQSFETNVKGSMISVKAFLPTANPSHAAIVGLTTAVVFPPTIQPGLSAYITSKFALVKFIEYVAAENPNVFAAAVNPGVINTAMFEKLGADPASLPFDSVDLPADFMVWLTSGAGSFLNGRFVYANWDVEELESRAEEILFRELLLPGISGWPFSSN